MGEGLQRARRVALASTTVVAEGLGATWFYHLRDQDAEKAFCGDGTFAKNLPLSLWGYKGHLNERYCPRCQAEGQQRGILPVNP